MEINYMSDIEALYHSSDYNKFHICYKNSHCEELYIYMTDL